MSSLSQLRANLEKVQSFQIPERYCHIPHASLSSDKNERKSNTPRHALSLDEDVKRRYFKARDQYIGRNTEISYRNTLGDGGQTPSHAI